MRGPGIRSAPRVVVTFALAMLLASGSRNTARAREAVLSQAAAQPVGKPTVTRPARDGTSAPRPVSELRAAIERDPNNPQLHVELGLAYWNRNDAARALSAFQRAVQVGPRSAEAHNWLGVALSERADLPGAIVALRKAIALDPRYGRAYTNLGSALASSGDFTEAVQVFQQALALEPNSIAAHMNLGLALRDKGDAAAALEHLRRVAASDPANASVQYELGQTLRQSGDLAGAIAAFEQALAIEPERRDAYYALGTALKQQSTALRKAPAPAASVSSSPPTPVSPAEAPFAQAREALGRGDLNAARESLTEALRLDDRHADAHNLLGFLLGQQGDLPNALVHLERAVALQPDSAEAHYNLGVALWYTGVREGSAVRDRAIAELRESVARDAAAGATYAFLGMALRERGDLPGARVNLQRAIALLPPTAAVYIDLGIAYLRAGELPHALGQFEAALNAPAPSLPAPDWNGAIVGLRRLLAASAPPAAGPSPAAGAPHAAGASQAADAPRTSGTSAAGRAEAHDALGLLLGRQGADSRDVTAAFREAIRLRPDYAPAHNHLGLVLIQAGDDPGGIAALREAVRISPDYADARANLGAALTPTDPKAAIVELEKAVALAPASVKAQFNLAVAYGANPGPPPHGGGPAKEIEQLRKTIALAPTFARAHVALGKALLQQGTVDEAIVALQEASRLDPQQGEAQYQLGLALARAGRKEEAAAALKKGRELVAADDRTQQASLDLAEGRAALEKGDLDQAAAKLRRAIEARPESADAQRSLGLVLERQGADDPARVATFESFIRQGQYREVEPLLAAYVKDRPRSSWGWYALGYSLFAQQKIGESIQALAKSLELDVRNVEAHKILGRNLMIIGRFDAAQAEFEAGIRYKPDSAELHYNLGKLLSIQDNWEPARKAFEAALRIEPSYLEALDALGFALEALGDDSGAVAKYEQVIALNETRKGRFASGHVNLSAYYNRTGDAVKALDYARQALALDPESDRAWFQKGRADERQGRLDDAVASVNRAIECNPRASSYYYVLAGLYRRLGKPDESKKALETFTRLEREASELDKMRRSPRSSASTPAPREGGRERE